MHSHFPVPAQHALPVALLCVLLEDCHLSYCMLACLEIKNQIDASLPGGPCWGAGCLTVPEWLLHDHHVIINLAHASVPLKVTNLARRLAFT